MKHSGYLTTSGAEIYYEQYGSSTPLLILHGNSQSLAVFYPFLRTFLPDFQVILMGQPGDMGVPGCLSTQRSTGSLQRIWQTTLSPCLTTYIFPPSTCWDSAMVPISGWRLHANTRSG